MAQLNITLNQDEILQLLGENSNEAFKTLLQDPDNIEENIKFYINSFSENVKDILENFDKKTMRNSFYSLKGQRVAGFNSIFAVSSIPVAMKYYNEFKRQLDQMHKKLNIATIFSFSANEDDPEDGLLEEGFDTDSLDQSSRDFLDSAISDYNKTFNTNFDTSSDKFQNYYKDLSMKMKNREIDLLIVVNMFLTGFDATTLNTLWVDKNLKQHGLIQAFSRTNRLLDENKKYGQIVTFRSPKEYKDKINDALLLYSKGGTGNVIAEDWYEVLESFSVSLKALKILTPTPSDAGYLSDKEKKQFIKLFRAVDHDFAHLKSFTTYEPKVVLDMGFSQEEYDDYAAFYKNIMAELREEKSDEDEEETVMDDYELVAFNKFHIDFEYIRDDNGEDYAQFIRELSIRCREEGLVVSTDNPPPKAYNQQYNYEILAVGDGCEDLFIKHTFTHGIIIKEYILVSSAGQCKV